MTVDIINYSQVTPLPTIAEVEEPGYTSEEAAVSSALLVLSDPSDCVAWGIVEEQSQASADLLSNDSVPSKEALLEQFWTEIGWPVEKRIWEERHDVSVNKEGLLSNELGSSSGLPIESQRGWVIHNRLTISMARPVGRAHPRLGFAGRPWRGPLPKRRSTEPLTLSAFMPPQLSIPTKDSRRPPISNYAVSGLVGDNSISGLEGNISHAVNVNHNLLIDNARKYGKSWWDILKSRPNNMARVQRQNQFPSLSPFPSLGATKLQSPPFCASSPPPLAASSSPPLAKLSYAAMAARQPRPNGPPPFRPPHPGRAQGFHQSRGRGPGRGDGHGSGRGCGFHGQGRGRGDSYGYYRGDGNNFGRGSDLGSGSQQIQRLQQGNPHERQNFSEAAQYGGPQGGQQPNVTQTEQLYTKKKRNFCWRCKCSGHSNEECIADLNCIVCNKKDSHVSFKCPILKMAKPNASFFGSGKAELGFLRVSDIDYKLETPDPAPTALITVTGGSLTAEIVQAELARLTRTDWNWEALPHGNETFLVAFPSEEELQRMADIGYHLKNHGVTLTITAWQSAHDITPTYQLEEIWVHITGVPHAWRHYLSFWALGTVVGATLEVDMMTYRKKGVIRVRVGVLDKHQFPHTTDVVFGTEGYHITYLLEDEQFRPATPQKHIHENLDSDDSGNANGGPSTKDQNMANKKPKNGHSAAGSSGSSGPTNVSSGPTPMQTMIAVTPFGNKRPSPPAKPLIMMNDSSVLPLVAVTKPRHLGLGANTSKLHVPAAVGKDIQVPVPDTVGDKTKSCGSLTFVQSEPSSLTPKSGVSGAITADHILSEPSGHSCAVSAVTQSAADIQDNIVQARDFKDVAASHMVLQIDGNLPLPEDPSVPMSKLDQEGFDSSNGGADLLDGTDMQNTAEARGILLTEQQLSRPVNCDSNFVEQAPLFPAALANSDGDAYRLSDADQLSLNPGFNSMAAVFSQQEEVSAAPVLELVRESSVIEVGRTKLLHDAELLDNGDQNVDLLPVQHAPRHVQGENKILSASGEPNSRDLGPISSQQEFKASDEVIMDKAKKRAAIRNLDGPAPTPAPKNKNLGAQIDTISGNGMSATSFHQQPPSSPGQMPQGYIFNYPLAPYLGDSPEVCFTGFGYSGITTIGAGGQGVFYPGVWVAV